MEALAGADSVTVNCSKGSSRVSSVMGMSITPLTSPTAIVAVPDVHGVNGAALGVDCCRSAGRRRGRVPDGAGAVEAERVARFTDGADRRAERRSLTAAQRRGIGEGVVQRTVERPLERDDSRLAVVAVDGAVVRLP